MQVAKWGNSLAVRIPASLVKALSLAEGDEVELRAIGDKQLGIMTERQRKDAIIEQIRKLARPLPDGYRFDREEVNARGPSAE